MSREDLDVRKLPRKCLFKGLHPRKNASVFWIQSKDRDRTLSIQPRPDSSGRDLTLLLLIVQNIKQVVRGGQGETVASYTLQYANGKTQTLPVRNGIEVAQSNRISEATRIAAIATAAQPAAEYIKDIVRERYQLLTTVPGIGPVNALTILSELILLAPAMTVRQWVASSGLDPVHRQSGTSLNKPSRISRAGNRRLRAALYMSALSASRYDRHLAAFYRALRARHKTGMQALMAVARKMLHAIYGIFKSGTPFDGQRLFPNIQTEVESIAG